ncbi:52 kDa repressor of the inhibitor of the protein kinase-like isoform X1 [Oratosquilla oratoria]|uniref:52 kDa repressor of the inhibitor of the protein kinase-like isoform X1 n=2 Tax=Oratosquilla oratoria TaxID=337810 RepID=UPI003F76DA2B
MSLGTHGWFKRSKSSHPEFMYHRFPKEPQRCSKWIQVTGISTLRKKTPTQLNKSQRICSHNFSQRQYASSTRLCPNAYPDQNLPAESSTPR